MKKKRKKQRRDRRKPVTRKLARWIQKCDLELWARGCTYQDAIDRFYVVTGHRVSWGTMWYTAAGLAEARITQYWVPPRRVTHGIRTRRGENYNTREQHRALAAMIRAGGRSEQIARAAISLRRQLAAEQLDDAEALAIDLGAVEEGGSGRRMDPPPPPPGGYRSGVWMDEEARR